MKQYTKITATIGLVLGVLSCSSHDDVPMEEACLGCSGALRSGCEQAYIECEDDPKCETAAVKEAFADEACQ